ncbi:unnamed protein product [Aphanomyces euteiches]
MDVNSTNPAEKITYMALHKSATKGAETDQDVSDLTSSPRLPPPDDSTRFDVEIECTKDRTDPKDSQDEPETMKSITTIEQTQVDVTTDYDDQINLVMMELEALNLLHSQLLEVKAKARDLRHQNHLQTKHSLEDKKEANIDMHAAKESIGSNPQKSDSPRHATEVTPVPTEKAKPRKTQKKRQLQVDATPLPPLQAYPVAAVSSDMVQEGGTYPWSKYMLQQMQQQMINPSHQGGLTPVVYVPILNPAYLAEVKQAEKKEEPSINANAPSIPENPPVLVKPPERRRIKKPTSRLKRPLVKKHTARDAFRNGHKVSIMNVSEPHKELAVCNEKYVKACTELVMSHRNIDVIGNFEAFVSLEVLWLNENNIQDITGLDNCFRIKCLYLQNNRISTLQGSLRHFTFLRELRLFNNRLHDLHTTLRQLSKLLHLEDLDLFGNPLAEEDKYRLHVIAAIPSLQIFDRHVVTPDERLRAKSLSIKITSNPHGRKRESGPTERYAPLSGTVKMLLKEVAHIERERKEQSDRELSKQYELPQQLSDALDSAIQRSNNINALASATGMDEWVLYHLRKTFASLDTKKLGLISEMLDQGQELFWNDQPIHEEYDISDLLPHLSKTIGPEPGEKDGKPRQLITWNALAQAMTNHSVGPDKQPFGWSPLAEMELQKRADMYFKKAQGLQKKLLGEPNEELKKKMHVYSQRGYHLEKLKSSKQELVSKQVRAPGPIARDSVTVFSYKQKDQQPNDKLDNTTLAKKYAIKDKDFKAFLSTKEARRPVKVTKETISL